MPLNRFEQQDEKIVTATPDRNLNPGTEGRRWMLSIPLVITILALSATASAQDQEETFAPDSSFVLNIGFGIPHVDANYRYQRFTSESLNTSSHSHGVTAEAAADVYENEQRGYAVELGGAAELHVIDLGEGTSFSSPRIERHVDFSFGPVAGIEGKYFALEAELLFELSSETLLELAEICLHLTGNIPIRTNSGTFSFVPSLVSKTTKDYGERAGSEEEQMDSVLLLGLGLEVGPVTFGIGFGGNWLHTQLNSSIFPINETSLFFSIDFE